MHFNVFIGFSNITLVCKKMAPVQKNVTRCKKMTPVAKK